MKSKALMLLSILAFLGCASRQDRFSDYEIEVYESYKKEFPEVEGVLCTDKLSINIKASLLFHIFGDTSICKGDLDGESIIRLLLRSGRSGEFFYLKIDGDAITSKKTFQKFNKIASERIGTVVLKHDRMDMKEIHPILTMVNDSSFRMLKPMDSSLCLHCDWSFVEIVNGGNYKFIERWGKSEGAYEILLSGLLSLASLEMDSKGLWKF